MDAVLDILGKTWAVTCQMAPYLLFGFAVAGVLSELISPRYVERHLGSGGIGPVIKASILGIPLPLCSCGVIPVGASLRRHGASPGATTSFLISTPQTGVDSIFVTYSLLGGVFAIFRPVVALVSGVFGGAMVNAFGGGHTAGAVDAVGGDACSVEAHKKGRWFGRMVRYGFVVLPADIGRSLLIGLLIAAVITAVAPHALLSDWVGAGIGSMLVMLVVGIPFYVCATASVPIAAALIATENVTPGAALVFLMTGPATNAATIVTIWKIMGRRSALIYLGAVMVTALASGLLLDAIFAAGDLPVAAGHVHPAGQSLLQTLAGVVLLAVLAPAILRPLVRGRLHPPGAKEILESMGTIVLKIEGMTCSHCAATVERALGECEGVESAAVDLAAGRATVVGEELDTGKLCAAVEALGYHATSADKPAAGGCCS